MFLLIKRSWWSGGVEFQCWKGLGGSRMKVPWEILASDGDLDGML